MEQGCPRPASGRGSESMALGPCGGRRRSVLDLGDLKAAMSESDHSDDESDSEDYESGEEADESQEDAQRPTVDEVAEDQECCVDVFKPPTQARVCIRSCHYTSV